MDKEDARYQTLAQLHERRKQVIRLHKRGIKVMQLVQMTGLSYPTVRLRWTCSSKVAGQLSNPLAVAEHKAMLACSRQSRKPTSKRPSATNAPIS